ncbi:MAG: 4-(cytidine 5'-diphospho)-2-C-methyl-D-erythritol kinase [Alphaproteobacteria bacterium]|nr:4-(cytidine 5'-diphospho)-2-C-methyl-D-erythritol kinase [Alphaproteobacteria bacterium]
MIFNPEYEIAPAKLNLFLHITGKRQDGYHLLESLVVFTDIADHVRITATGQTDFQVTGSFAHLTGAMEHNLVYRAYQAYESAIQRDLKTVLSLEKNIPVGAGLGGGSSDAAAALRLLHRLYGSTKIDIEKMALTLGADVPVCLQTRAQIMRGVGEKIHTLSTFPRLPVLMIWPDVICETASVFKALSFTPAPPVSIPNKFETADEVIGFLAETRNDLEKTAMNICPAIQTVLEEMRAQKGIRLARMTGSGSACFGICDDFDVAEHAKSYLGKKYPSWWCHAGYINP